MFSSLLKDVRVVRRNEHMYYQVQQVSLEAQVCSVYSGAVWTAGACEAQTLP